MHQQHRKYSSNALDAHGLEALNGLAYLLIVLIDILYNHLKQKIAAFGSSYS
jgi:hypothetical protein